MERIYRHETDGGGHSVRKTRTGYAVSGWSRMQGSLSGYERLIPTAVAERHGLGPADGEQIALLAGENVAGVRVLRRGEVVR